MALSSPAFSANARIRRAALNAPPIQYGERGPAMAVLQAALIDLGYRMPHSTRQSGLPDGIFGRETRDTVYRFQVDRHLKGTDGVAGRETFARLDQLVMAGSSSPQPPPHAPPLPTTRDY